MDKLVRNEIRDVYKRWGSEIERGARLSPYDLGIDWLGLMTPIEDYVWGAIRYLGLPLYPQYPIKNYFVDFGDPKNRIGIEVDSKRWHQNKEKDRHREKEIKQEGWHLERIPSGFVYKCGEDFLEENENGAMILKPEYYYECAEGILKNLYRDILSLDNSNRFI